MIFGSARAPGGGHGNPLQYSCLENPKDRGPWQATVSESDMTEETSHIALTTNNNVYKAFSRGFSTQQAITIVITVIGEEKSRREFQKNSLGLNGLDINL